MDKQKLNKKIEEKKNEIKQMKADNLSFKEVSEAVKELRHLMSYGSWNWVYKEVRSSCVDVGKELKDKSTKEKVAELQKRISEVFKNVE